jgi:hypothetical protein
VNNASYQELCKKDSATPHLAHEGRSIEKGIEVVIGYLTSIAAWAGGELAEDGVDLSVVLHWLAIKGQEYLERVDRDFGAEIIRKRVKFGLQVSGKQ